jgi:hypothetical protein
VLSKVFGSTNPINVVKATYGALRNLRTVAQFEKQRGIAVVERKNKAPLGPVGTGPAAGAAPAVGVQP